MWIAQFQSHFHRPVSDLWSNMYSLSRDRKPANLTENEQFFHKHAMNISRIANLNAGAEWAATAEQFTNWPCHDTIKT